MGLIIGGSFVCLVAVFFMIGAIVAMTTGREIPVFKLFVKKSIGLWKDKVYVFYLVSGILMLTCGIVMITSFLW